MSDLLRVGSVFQSLPLRLRLSQARLRLSQVARRGSGRGLLSSPCAWASCAWAVTSFAWARAQLICVSRLIHAFISRLPLLNSAF